MLSLSYSAVLGEFQLEPLNLTVLQGSDARFNATVTGPWRVMTWDVGGLMVLNILITGDIASSSEQFSAGFCSNDRSCVEFTIRNVTRSMDASPVICRMLGDPGSKTAQLYIQGRIIPMQTLFRDWARFGTWYTCYSVAVP